MVKAHLVLDGRQCVLQAAVPELNPEPKAKAIWGVIYGWQSHAGLQGCVWSVEPLGCCQGLSNVW